MGISLKKGSELDLNTADPSLDDVYIGLGWDASSDNAVEFDLDACIFMLNREDKVRSSEDLIFYNQVRGEDDSVIFGHDNRTGEGYGDDEYLIVNLSRVPWDIMKLSICVTIYDAQNRQQSFGKVKNSFVRLVNKATHREVARYDLTENCTDETAFVFGELIRSGQKNWSFRAAGQGYTGSLRKLCDLYGVNVID